MGIQRALVNIFDRPGRRGVLSKIATWCARLLGVRDCVVFYDGAWIHGVGRTFVADDPVFRYPPGRIKTWRKGAIDLADSQELWFQHYKPQPGDVIVDVGAGNGSDVVLFSRAVGETGKVLAIEAHPDTYGCLCKTIALNHLNNVAAIQCAVMDKEGMLYIETRGDHLSNTVAASADNSGTMKAVRGMTLDELAAQQKLERIDFLKMNIEGAEQFAILGMVEILPKIRHICVACHDFLGEGKACAEQYCTREKVRAFLIQHGFRVTDRLGDPRVYVKDHLHAVRAE